MESISITEQEVMDFTDALSDSPDDEDSEETPQYIRHPRPNPDSLYTMPTY